MPTFEKLDVWKDACNLAVEIFCLTKQFSAPLQYSLGDQLRRASLSISSNIAEGSGAESRKDELRFLDISIKSCFECISQLYFYEKLEKRDMRDLIEKMKILTRRIRSYKAVRVKYMNETS